MFARSCFLEIRESGGGKFLIYFFGSTLFVYRVHVSFILQTGKGLMGFPRMNGIA